MRGKGVFATPASYLKMTFVLVLVLAVWPVVGHAKGGHPFAGVNLSMSSPTVPAGGLLQMQVFMTEPKPILKGKQGMKSSLANVQMKSPLGPFRDAALFSSGGDVSGVIVNASGEMLCYFSSPLETFGMSTDTPIMTVAYPVLNTASTGQSVPLTLDAGESMWLDPNSKQYPEELNSGAMTVGGTLSISDVVPGDGIVPAGTIISISGTGFQSNSQIDMGEETKIATQQYVSPNLIDVTLRGSANLRGQRIRIKNSGNEQATYFPYQRTKRTGTSKHGLVATSFPLFAQTSLTLGYFQPTLHGTIFSGIALQNLNPASVTATLQLYSSAKKLIATKKIALAKNTYVARDLAELFPGVSPTDGTSLKVTTGTGIQMLGLLGDDSSDMLLPVTASPTP